MQSMSTGELGYEVGADHQNTFSGPGAAQCDVCPDGTTSLSNAEQCDPCPEGQWSTGGGNCVSCSAGLGPTFEGWCEPCAENTYNAGGPQSQGCSACPAGQFAPPGASACSCPDGSQDDGNGGCQTCPVNTFSTGGTSCLMCPPGMVSQAGSAACQCAAGFFASSNEACSACPEVSASVSIPLTGRTRTARRVQPNALPATRGGPLNKAVPSATRVPWGRSTKVGARVAPSAPQTRSHWVGAGHASRVPVVISHTRVQACVGATPVPSTTAMAAATPVKPARFPQRGQRIATSVHHVLLVQMVMARMSCRKSALSAPLAPSRSTAGDVRRAKLGLARAKGPTRATCAAREPSPQGTATAVSTVRMATRPQTGPRVVNQHARHDSVLTRAEIAAHARQGPTHTKVSVSPVLQVPARGLPHSTAAFVQQGHSLQEAPLVSTAPMDRDQTMPLRPAISALSARPRVKGLAVRIVRSISNPTQTRISASRSHRASRGGESAKRRITSVRPADKPAWSKGPATTNAWTRRPVWNHVAVARVRERGSTAPLSTLSRHRLASRECVIMSAQRGMIWGREGA
ncbi:hypothetical protein IAU60_005432 [Kwoniella sp. DSM 27419]